MKLNLLIITATIILVVNGNEIVEDNSELNERPHLSSREARQNNKIIWSVIKRKFKTTTTTTTTTTTAAPLRAQATDLTSVPTSVIQVPTSVATSPMAQDISDLLPQIQSLDGLPLVVRTGPKRRRHRYQINKLQQIMKNKKRRQNELLIVKEKNKHLRAYIRVIIHLIEKMGEEGLMDEEEG